MGDLRALADACLLPPFVGTTAPDWVLRRLEGGLRGVTLFGRNVVSREQVARLTAQLREARGDVLVAIDEEGGDVTRLEYGVGSSYPGNLALGAVDDVALTREVAAAIGAELASVGVTLDLAPDADVNSNPRNPVIGVRSFGSDPALVARHVAAYVDGLQSRGVLACAKHFPGHGDTVVDSHLGLPVVEATADALDAALAPFRAAIAAGVRAVMTAHLVVPALDDQPATVSRRILTGLLRDELGFDGLVVTDAVDMGAVADGIGSAEAAVRALAAGADAICVGGGDTGEEAVDALTDAIVVAVDDGRLPLTRLEEAAERVAVAAASARLSAEIPQRDVGLRAARRALSVTGAPADAVALAGAPLVVELRTPPTIAVGTVPWGLGDALAAREPRARVVQLTGPDPQLESVVAAAGGRPIVLVVRDLARFGWATDAAATVLRRRPDAVVVDMGWPGAAPSGARVVLTTYGAARVNALAAAEVLLPGEGT